MEANESIIIKKVIKLKLWINEWSHTEQFITFDIVITLKTR